MEYPLIPFNEIDNKYVPNPRSIIQVAISDCLAKGINTERDIAIHVCHSLYNFMTYTDCFVTSVNRDDLLEFKQPGNEID